MEVRRIAGALGAEISGVNLRSLEDDAVKRINTQLDTIDQKALNDVSYMNYKTFFQWFVGLSLLLLAIDFFIPERKKLAV